MIERRFFVRYPMRGTMMFQPVNSIRPLKGELIDISFKGIAALTKLPLDRDSIVKFILVNKEYEVRLQGAARVIYSEQVSEKNMEKYRAGLVFVKVDSEVVRNLVLNLEKAYKLAQAAKSD